MAGAAVVAMQGARAAAGDQKHTDSAPPETAVEPKFQDYFVEAMAIPNKRDPFHKLFATVEKPAKKSARTDAANARRRRRKHAS